MGAALRYVIDYPVRPWTTNKDRNLYPQARAKLVKEWREAFKSLAIEENIPALEKIGIVATPILPDRKFQDTAACNPAVKAAIDGIVDAGVVPDDTPEYLGYVKFKPCVYVKGEAALVLEIVELYQCDVCGKWYDEPDPLVSECCGGE